MKAKLSQQGLKAQRGMLMHEVHTTTTATIVNLVRTQIDLGINRMMQTLSVEVERVLQDVAPEGRPNNHSSDSCHFRSQLELETDSQKNEIQQHHFMLEELGSYPALQSIPRPRFSEPVVRLQTVLPRPEPHSSISEIPLDSPSNTSIPRTIRGSASERKIDFKRFQRDLLLAASRCASPAAEHSQEVKVFPPEAEIDSEIDSTSSAAKAREFRAAGVRWFTKVLPTPDADEENSEILSGFPISVSGGWQRQAAFLAERFRAEMKDLVEFKKRGMSFRGGLWWLRHLVGVRALARPRVAMAISGFFISLGILLLAGFFAAEFWLARAELSSRKADVALYLNQTIFLLSALIGLVVHHNACWWSDSVPSPGEQDALLQAHSIAFSYIDRWLIVSRRKGQRLFMMWLASIAVSILTHFRNTGNLSQGTQALLAVPGILSFVVSSGITCALSMRVLHICTAMRSSLIAFIVRFSEVPIPYWDMVQEWNSIQIFIKSLSDGCAPALVCQLATIPVLLGTAIVKLLGSDVNFADLTLAVMPFLMLSMMPLYALMTAADVTSECQHVPQVANSMMVADFGNPLVQDLLDFMARCKVGYYISDVCISRTDVMKTGYILFGILLTVLVEFVF
eukprot:TRINITY_DN42421_c0_g1_i1.p1 TRINITY_DN42421_c0_g1~~TRINITY_DN42421_c0_g1_i1.p1  ORF type:complete len:624 (+),score=84.50 TRINITY_DN42421_c0_g1_i1:127-1998(+)